MAARPRSRPTRRGRRRARLHHRAADRPDPGRPGRPGDRPRRRPASISAPGRELSKRIVTAPTSRRGAGRRRSSAWPAERCAGGGPAVLVPCSDAAVLAISAGGSGWPRLPLRPAGARRRRAADGQDPVRRARPASGLPIPETRILRSRARRRGRRLRAGLPGRRQAGTQDAGWQAATRAKVFRVEDAAELLADLRPVRRPGPTSSSPRRGSTAARPTSTRRTSTSTERRRQRDVHRPEDPPVAARDRDELPRRGGPQRRDARRLRSAVRRASPTTASATSR